jgi:hypothetical protein
LKGVGSPAKKVKLLQQQQPNGSKFLSFKKSKKTPDEEEHSHVLARKMKAHQTRQGAAASSVIRRLNFGGSTI